MSTQTLDVFCAHCGGAVTLQFGSWKPEDIPVVQQGWDCPYCEERNNGGFPGRLVWVTKGYARTRPV